LADLNLFSVMFCCAGSS